MLEADKAVVVIPARIGSTRLPEKCLIPLCGKPMILWVVEAASQCGHIDRVMVATDDPRILDTVRQHGYEAVLTRQDHPSGTDRVAEALTGCNAGIVVNVQGDEPLIDPRLIDRLVITMRTATHWDMATAAAPIIDPADRERPAVVKVVWDASGRALYFSRAPIPFVRDPDSQAPGSIHWRHLGIYAYRRPFLDALVQAPPCPTECCEKLEQLRALHIGGQIAVLATEDRGAGVDTIEDVARVECQLRKRQRELPEQERGNA